MSNPFFSVIVPVHNAVEHMRPGFDSIRAQTFNGFELIAVCDKCTDASAVIAAEYANTVIITEHGRDGLARNAGIDAAHGEWILFMDDDDWWLHPYAFEMIAGRAAQDDVDVITFGFLARDFIRPGLQLYTNTKQHVWPAVWNKTYRRELIGASRFPGIEFTSDLPFTIELFGKQPRVAFLEQAMYFYNYMRKGSQTEQHSREAES